MAAGSSQLSTQSAPEQKPAAILLIEDNPADALLVTAALQERSLSELERLPDIILLDLGLPMTDGIDVLRAIRGMPKRSDQ